MSSVPPPPPIVPPPPIIRVPVGSPVGDPDESTPAAGAERARRAVARRYVADQPGQLTLGWTTVFWLGWLLVAASFGAVWYSSYLTGFSTWWLGPESDPHILLMGIPFLAPLALCIGALRGARHLPLFGIGGAAITAAIAAGDLGARTGYALVEFGIAAGGLLLSAACFAGRLREEPARSESSVPPAPLADPPAG